MLPDFFIIGPPKSGTTALHVALAAHPQVFMSPTKEPRFFMTDGQPPMFNGPGAGLASAQFVWSRDEYEELFAGAPAGALRGESTPLYLSAKAAHRRIRDLVPHARLIALLRDPVDRAHSQWMHYRSVGLEPEGSFLAACALEEERQRQGWAPQWSYLEQSRYGEQIDHLYRFFPPEQVLVLRYSDLCDAPETVITRVCEFLGVETGVVRSVPTVNVTADVADSVGNDLLRRLLRRGSAIAYGLPGPIPEAIGRVIGTPTIRLLQRRQQTRHPVTREQRSALIPEFASDIALLERITGIRFPEWQDLDYSPVRSPVREGQRVGGSFTSISRPLSQ